MKKIYILDTNVLLHDPKAIYRFDDNDIVIPMVVLEELDNIKVGADEVSRNARHAIRELDKLRECGSLHKGISLGDGKGSIKIELNHQDHDGLPPYLNKKNNDNRILSVVVGLTKEKQLIRDKEKIPPVILVSKDVNLRVKADALGVASQDYKAGKVEVGDINETFLPVRKNKPVVKAVEGREGWFSVTEPALYGIDNVEVPDNSFICAPDANLFRIKGGVLNDVGNKTIWGIKAKNSQQICAINTLLDDSLRLVAITGSAGAGKTLLAVASGLRQVIEEKSYKRLMVTKAVVPMGRDIGYIPGTVEEKFLPWMQSLYDTVDYLVSLETPKNKHFPVEKLKEKGILQMEPLVYIRGRSLPHQYIIVDEAQNMTVHEIKTLITRAGEGSKVVLLGDIHQIDTPYLDTESNGLSYVISRFKGNSIFGHINLTKGERSALAEVASGLL